MQFVSIFFPALIFIALPVLAIVWAFRLNRRVNDIAMKAALEPRENQALQQLTARVYALEKQIATLLARDEKTPMPEGPSGLTAEAETPHPALPETAPDAMPARAPIVPVDSGAPPASEAAPVAQASATAEESGASAVLDASATSGNGSSGAPREFETNIGLAWINRIAAVTLIFAAAFFFKYAVDNQWIGETGRVVLGVIAGFAALGCGEWAWRRDHRVYAQGVTALGIAILYLAFYAAFAFYRLPSVPQSLAFCLMVLTTAMGGALAMRYNAAAISALALLGGFLTPVLLSTGEDRPWVLFGYILLLDLGTLAVARAKRWRHLAPLALAGTSILYCVWFAGNFEPGEQVVATTFALVYYALFVLVESEAIVVLAQLLANLALLAIANELGTGGSWLLSNGWTFVAVAAAGIVVSESRRRPVLTRAAAAIFWLCLAIWQSDIGGPFPSRVVPAALAGFALFLGYQAWRVASRRERAKADALALLAVNAAAAFGVLYYQLNSAYHAWLGLTAAAFAAVHLLAAAWIWEGMGSVEDEAARDKVPVLLLLGVALSFLTLAAPIQFSAYRITMAWALEAAALVWIARRSGSVWLRHGAMLVFVLAFFRLMALDAWIFATGSQYNLIANARFLTFAVVAASLWLSVPWLQDKEETLIAYVGGHAVLLWSLVMEVLGQAQRSAPPDKIFSVGTVSVSVLIAAYGVILIGAFVLGRFALNRWLGLIALGFVVLKLYLSDVWVLERIYRVVAFGLLGILLLLTSFLYSRYRTKIGDWWNVDSEAGK
jgi:hypothetical protein